MQRRIHWYYIGTIFSHIIKAIAENYYLRRYTKEVEQCIHNFLVQRDQFAELKKTKSLQRAAKDLS